MSLEIVTAGTAKSLDQVTKLLASLRVHVHDLSERIAKVEQGLDIGDLDMIRFRLGAIERIEKRLARLEEDPRILDEELQIMRARLAARDTKLVELLDLFPKIDAALARLDILAEEVLRLSTNGSNENR